MAQVAVSSILFKSLSIARYIQNGISVESRVKMHREFLRPGEPLSRFVELLWYYQNESTAHGKERLMPDGCSSLVINLAEDTIRVSVAEDSVLLRAKYLLRRLLTVLSCS